jgi:hypothetical protein
MPESPPPSPAEPVKAFKGRLIVIGAIAGTLIGVLAIVIPLAVAAGTSTSSTETLEVQSEDEAAAGADPNAGSGLEAVQAGLQAQALGASTEYSENEGMPLYAVPIDAPWEELWAIAGPAERGCVVPEKIAWLEEHGVPMPPQKLFAAVVNTASAGSEITISEIRPQGELTAPQVDTVLVEYLMCVGGGEEGIYAHITLGTDPVAIFDNCYTEGDGCYVPADGGPAPGDPVVFTVRPGETRSLHVSYDQSADFVGRFVATVTVDGQSSTIDLSPGAADIVAPAVTRPLLLLKMTETLDAVKCSADQGDASSWIEACTLEQWLAYLAES